MLHVNDPEHYNLRSHGGRSDRKYRTKIIHNTVYITIRTRCYFPWVDVELCSMTGIMISSNLMYPVRVYSLSYKSQKLRVHEDKKNILLLPMEPES